MVLNGEGLNSDCHTLLIYKDTLMTEDWQTKAHHDFFVRRYNINADLVERSLKMEPSK